jgi:hypothetical protein
MFIDLKCAEIKTFYRTSGMDGKSRIVIQLHCHIHRLRPIFEIGTDYVFCSESAYRTANTQRKWISSIFVTLQNDSFKNESSINTTQSDTTKSAIGELVFLMNTIESQFGELSLGNESSIYAAIYLDEEQFESILRAINASSRIESLGFNLSNTSNDPLKEKLFYGAEPDGSRWKWNVSKESNFDFVLIDEFSVNFLNYVND